MFFANDWLLTSSWKTASKKEKKSNKYTPQCDRFTLWIETAVFTDDTYYIQQLIYELYRPRFNVAALLHESSQWEPETVKDGKVVGDWRTVCVVLNVPLKRTEATHQEQDDTDADVREYDAHPDLVG